jgi:phage host-nuclease inhibitor protein Gam
VSEPQLRAEIERLRADADRLRLCCEALRDALNRYGETKRLNWRAAVEMIDAALGEEGVP